MNNNSPDPITDLFEISGKTFSSRLLIGTGKYASNPLMKEAILASGAEIVTTAIRRVDLDNKQDPFVTHISPDDFVFLGNTSGARDADEALRLAHAIRASGISNWIKLEVIPDPRYLMPDPVETFIAAERLIKEGFIVFPYIHADPVLAKKLEDVGCATVMPLASPIGSNQGLKMAYMIQLIIDQSNVPVIIDAGIGCPSDAVKVMEMGADAVMINTAIATAQNPVGMAESFKWAVHSGRQAFLSGLPSSGTAAASSPLTDFLTPSCS
ncbi:MAG: thiazole synthase [bacterium]